ncbi:MAG: sigma-54-dependent Fis family transcriptional regulator [Candidatus Cloacimonetes bacterium]|nr:sigma-54-dependent Fis family transcriptional regulator [Candidatus Cloacimonadota bacterium]
MRILIIDDEINICKTLKNILEDDGYFCEFSLNGRDGISRINKTRFDVILLDVRLSDANGLDILEKILILDPKVSVIMISGHSGIKEAVKAIKLGAFDFLEKPLSLTKVKLAVKNAFELVSISKDYSLLKQSVDEQYKIVGKGTAIKELLDLVGKVAPSDSKVLIRGESGTGKELVAYAIHNQSKRKNKPFIKFNSAAIPNELVESELFGYEKGAFTGASLSKEGKIEQANGGTLFLDEIGDMNMNAQAKILRVIQEGEFERVGGNKTQKIDTRIIAATHKNLERLVEEGGFREDLYYRLNVIPIETPALRDHPEDIPVILNFYSQKYATELKLPVKTFDKSAMRELHSWIFKGNVRELKNLIERIYILIDKNNITDQDVINLSLVSKDIDFWNQTTNFKAKRREFETKYLLTQLKLNNGSLSKTAEILGLQISNLSRKVKELGIDVHS